MIDSADFLKNEEPTGDGVYVYVKREDNHIIIRQDFIGSYEIYLYMGNDYFALSNSFVMLVDHVKKAHKISLNSDYANLFIIDVRYSSVTDFVTCRDLTSSAPQKSLINNAWLKNFVTARIDIKNASETNEESNDLEIINISDTDAKVISPKWFTTKGKGYIVTSMQGSLDITFRCIKPGRVRIHLRGIDVRDKDNRRIPYWIDFQKMCVDEKVIFNEPQPVWHDVPFSHAFPAADGQTVTLSLAWLPHVPSSQRTD